MISRVFFSFILFTAFTASLYGQAENFTLKNYKYKFSLEEKDGKCTLKYSKGKASNQLILDIAPNCKLIKWGVSNKIRVHYYKDIKATVLMIGGEIHNGDCKEGTAKSTQTILVSQNSIKLGSKRNGTCLPDGPDEKEYWISSH